MEHFFMTLIDKAINGLSLKSIIAYAIVGLLIGFAKSIRFVQEGSQGMKMRFGKVVRHRWGTNAGKPKIITPGICVLIPFIDTLKRHPIKQQTIKLTDQKVILRDDTTWVMSAVMLYRITDIYKALFDVDNVDGSLQDIGSGQLREVMQQLTTYDELKDIASVSGKLLHAMQEQQNDWGVDIVGFKLVDCAPDATTARFLSSKAGYRMQFDALKSVGVDPQTQPELAGIML